MLLVATLLIPLMTLHGGPMVTDRDSTNVTANPTDEPCDPTDVTGDLTDVTD